MALPFFTKKKERSLGVDIGTSAVRVVELSKEGDKIELTNYGELSGGAGVAFHSSLVRLTTSQAVDAIRQILREANLAPASTTMSVPIFSGFSTVISLPHMSEAELEQAVSFEARKYIPLPFAEVQFEWTKLDDRQTSVETSAKQTQDIRVLVVAVTNEIINRYKEIAKQSSLALSALELDTFSLARSLKHKKEGSALIIDIGAHSTILTVIEREWPVITRTLDVAGREFSGTLASSLGIDFMRAENLKRRDGVGAGQGVLYPLLDSIIFEGKRIIEEYRQDKKGSLDQVIISGGTAQMPGLLNYVVKTLGKESRVGFPFHGIIYPRGLEKTLQEIGPAFSVAVGAALREFT